MAESKSPGSPDDERLIRMCVGMLEGFAAIAKDPVPASLFEQLLIDQGVDDPEDVTAALVESGYIRIDERTRCVGPGSRLVDLVRALRRKGDDPMPGHEPGER